MLLKWVIFFLIVSVVAAILGFTGVAVGAAAAARIFFWVFLVLFLVALVMSLVGRGGGATEP